MSVRSSAGSTYLGVQVLRFVAALLVVFPHAVIYLEERSGESTPDIPTGQIGVTTFFAISGFVAVLVTSRRPEPSWSDFIRRRLIRIVPLAWALTTVKLVVSLTAPAALLRSTSDPFYVIASYLFIPARGPDGLVQPLFTVQWTLAHELFFYALVATALALGVDVLRFVAPVYCTLALASVLRPEAWPSWQFYADPYVLCFLVGMVIARWTVERKSRRAVVALAGIIGVWFAVELVDHAAVEHVILLPIACAALSLAVLGDRMWRSRVGPGLRTLGDASYALYLTHPLVAPALVALCTMAPLRGLLPWWVVVAVAATGATGAAVVVWQVVDRPVLRSLLRWTAPKERSRQPRHAANGERDAPTGGRGSHRR